MLKFNPFSGKFDIVNDSLNYLREASTIADFRAGETFYYVGDAPITYDYDLLPYPLPLPISGFNFVNLSTFDVTINSDGGNATYVLKPTQSLQDVQVTDNGGFWAAYATQYFDNIYDLQQVTNKGNVTTNAIILRNNPDTYRTRYSILGQGIQRTDLGFDLNYYDTGITKLATGSKTWQLQMPDLTANANSSSFAVDFRPNVSGTVAYLSDIANSILGRVLFVSKSGNDAEAIIGSQAKSYLTIQEAWNASSPNDTIIVYNGTYTENIALGANNPNRTIILIDANINGTINNTTFNGCNYGKIVGIGRSTIVGAFSLTGANTGFESIENVTFNVLPSNNFTNGLYKNCNFNLTTEGSVRGVYENCNIVSSSNLISTYGAEAGFQLFNCKVTCLNFSNPTGGTSSGGGSYVIQNSRINCTNFFSCRGTATLQITDSTIKASGNSFFFTTDGVALHQIQAINSVLQTGCTNLNQQPLNANSIVNAVCNKPLSATYLGVQTVISTLNLI